MSTPDPQFLPFPEPMIEELRRLEQAKMHLIAGFLYATGLKEKSVRVAADLSGIELSAMHSAVAQPISQTPSNNDNTHI
ncbi:MAG: hypothetical protein KJZ84_09255 [Bryobacteraceae bacterium]|nr:hypothetical protein [Bryobacteraceae bacterium]